MKNCIYVSFLTIGLTFIINSTNAQQLVKPVENKAVKQAEVRNTPNISTNETPTVTKNGTVIQPKTEEQKATINVTEATKDSENYQAIKMDYIRNNPEVYKQYCGNPNLTILTEAEFNALPVNEQVRISSDEINYLIIR